MIAQTKKYPAQEKRQKCQRAAYAETYEDVRWLIWKVVSQHNAQHGGDIEEQMAEANLAYMEALEKYNSQLGAFTTILVWCIRGRLSHQLRRRIARNPRARDSILQRWPARRGPVSEMSVDEDGMSDINSLTDRPDRSPFEVDEFLADASEDAQMVLQMALEFEEELKQEVRQKPRTLRSTLRDALRRLGWTMARITESFGEIREALG